MVDSRPSGHERTSSNLGVDAATAGGTSVSSADEPSGQGPPTPYLSSNPSSPIFLSRSSSYLGSAEDFSDLPPPEKLTFFDIFENLSLPSRIEKWQATISAQRDTLKRQQQKLRTSGKGARDRAVAEFKKRVPTADEQLAKYRSRMKTSVDDLNKRWKDTVTITIKEKISFISAVLNIFLSGYLIGAAPEHFYYWYTAQLLYFMPIRYITYHRKGYHYFLADLCYFVNFLCFLSVWVFPQSKRLFISTWCLAYGNNAVAIVMWRNSLVFHSLDKVTSLFIHVMPPVMLHCIAHLTPQAHLLARFPAVHAIKFSTPGSPEHYNLWQMLLWATLPYAVWQFSYHFFITVRRREKIAAGRPTSFTWLRRSYAKTWIGKFVLSLPDALQEPAFMMIQYSYACLTIIPCPLWFWYRWASASFMLFVFSWSVWNGANYYMDVFGTRFKKELEQMKKDVAKWQGSPGSISALASPTEEKQLDGILNVSNADNGAQSRDGDTQSRGMGVMEMMQRERQQKEKRSSVDNIPLLDSEGKVATTSSSADTTKEQQDSAKATGAKIMDDADGSGMTGRK